VPGKPTDGPAQAAARVGAEGFAERTRRELLATGATVRKRNVETLVFGPLRLALSAGAAAALLVGWVRPVPWLLVAILSVVWFFAVSRFLRADAWVEP
jgi:hypothetical protein